MTESEYNSALASGSVSAEPLVEEEASTPVASSDISMEQFIPILLHLQSTQQYLTVAPTYVPKTFQEQIAFVFDGTNYYLYLYFNNHWKRVAMT